MTELNETKYSMVFTIIDKGYADVVVATANEAGAGGSTMIHARGSGVHETEKFLNISIEPEKEIVMTLVNSADVKDVISMITDRAGLATAARGISFTLPVTRTAGIDSAWLAGKNAEADSISGEETV